MPITNAMYRHNGIEPPTTRLEFKIHSSTTLEQWTVDAQKWSILGRSVMYLEERPGYPAQLTGHFVFWNQQSKLMESWGFCTDSMVVSVCGISTARLLLGNLVQKMKDAWVKDGCGAPPPQSLSIRWLELTVHEP